MGAHPEGRALPTPHPHSKILCARLAGCQLRDQPTVHLSDCYLEFALRCKRSVSANSQPSRQVKLTVRVHREIGGSSVGSV